MWWFLSFLNNLEFIAFCLYEYKPIDFANSISFYSFQRQKNKLFNVFPSLSIKYKPYNDKFSICPCVRMFKFTTRVVYFLFSPVPNDFGNPDNILQRTYTYFSPLIISTVRTLVILTCKCREQQFILIFVSI